MKRILFGALLAFVLLLPCQALAGHSHYLNGIEGIRAASLPPEGFYWRVYSVYYKADEMRDKYGKANRDFDANVFGLINRFIYTTPVKVLGGSLTMDLIIPMVNSDIKMKGAFDHTKFGVGDIIVEPAVVHWHGARWDAVLGVGVFLPTGDYSRGNAASPGKGYTTFMGSFGGTLYFDEAKTWSVSALGRYETHTRQESTRIKPGDDVHFEWGVGKNFGGVFDVGVAGYCQWQLDHDSGAASGSLERAYAAGPEIGYTYAPWGLNVTLRSLWEFKNKNTSQGNITSLVFTKAF